MEKADNLINELFTSAEDYIELKTESLKLGFYQQATSVLSRSVETGILLVFGLFTLLLLSLAGAFWFSRLLHSFVAGFLVMAAFYLILFTVYFFFRHKLGRKTLRNTILQQVTGTKNDYEALLSQKVTIDSRLDASQIRLKNNALALKSRLEEMQEQLSRLKAQFLPGQDSTGGALSRMAATTAISMLLNAVLSGSPQLVRKALAPVIGKAIAGTGIFKKKQNGTGNGVLHKLKLKFGRMFKQQGRQSNET